MSQNLTNPPVSQVEKDLPHSAASYRDYIHLRFRRLRTYLLEENEGNEQ